MTKIVMTKKLIQEILESDAGRKFLAQLPSLPGTHNYNTDLDYVLGIEIYEDELKGFIAEADRIINGNEACPQNQATAYLKKAQCLQKLEDKICMGITEGVPEKHAQEKIEEIKENIEKALELSPNMPEALMQMGILYSKMSKPEDAIDMLSRAIKIKPDYAAAFNIRSIVYCREKNNTQDNLEKAIADLTEAIRIRPYDAAYYSNRGDCYDELKEYGKAIADYSNAEKYGFHWFKGRKILQ